MKNAVGREIPDELLVNGKEGYQGKFYMDGKYLRNPPVRKTPGEQDCGLSGGGAESLRRQGRHDLLLPSSSEKRRFCCQYGYADRH